MGRRTRKKWDGITIDSIVAMMKVISSNLASWNNYKRRNKKSAWYRLAYRLLNGTPSDEDCMHFVSMFHRNQRNMQTKFLNSIGIQVIPPPPRASTPVEQEERHCYCNRPYNADVDISMVQCDFCNKWYHGGCVDISIKEAQEISTYICPSCSGNPAISDLVPPIVRNRGSVIKGTDINDDIISPVRGEIDDQTIDGKLFETELGSPKRSAKNETDQRSTVSNKQKKRKTSRSRRKKEELERERSFENSNITNLKRSRLEEHKTVTNLLDKSTDEKNVERGKRNLPADVETEFDIVVSRAEWSQFVLKTTTKKGKLSAGWVDVIADKFSAHNPYCVFNVKYKNVHQKPGSAHYLTGCGYCSFKDCFTFPFKAMYKPTKNQDMIVHIKSDGVFSHNEGEFKGRQIRALKRAQMREKLAYVKANVVATALHSKANDKAVDYGNITNLANRNTIRNIRHEALKQDDFAADPVNDLLQMFYAEDASSPFIRQISIKPLLVTYTLNRCLDVIKLFRRYSQHVVGHFDSTGGVIKKLKHSFNPTKIKVNSSDGPVSKKNYVYSMVVQNPSPQIAPMPVFEFISNQHDINTIQSGLNTFFDAAKKHLNLPAGANVFSRIETDFSLAMIGAVLRSCLNTNTRQYLIQCWDIVFHGSRVFTMNLHVCQLHVANALNRQLRSLYGKESICLSLLESMMQGLLRSRKMESIVCRVSWLFKICSRKKKDKAFRKDLKSYKKNPRTPSDYGELEGRSWLQFNVADFPDFTIHKSSSFGKYFYSLWDRISIESVEADLLNDKCKKNKYYCTEFIVYMLEHVLPYTPLITLLMFEANNDLVVETNNNPVELWNKIKKIDGPARHGQQKIGRYLRQTETDMMARANEFKKGVLQFYKKKIHVESSDDCNKNSGNSDTENAPLKTTKKRTTKTETWRKRVANNKVLPNVIEKSLQTQTGEITSIESNDEEPNLKRKTYEETKSYNLTEYWNKKSKRVAQPNQNLQNFNDLPFLPWGQHCKDSCQYLMTNTCTIDNVIEILTIMFETSPIVRQFLYNSDLNVGLKDKLVQVIHHVQHEQFNQAKAVFIQDRVSLDTKKINNLMGDEIRLGTSMLHPLFANYNECIVCPDHSDFPQIEKTSISRFSCASVNRTVHKLNGNKQCKHHNCQLKTEGKCDVHQIRYFTVSDAGPVPFVVFELVDEIKLQKTQDTLSTVPRVIDNLLGSKYNLFACTIFLPDAIHYIATFWSANEWIKYDGMKKGFKKGPKKDYIINTAWYIIET